MENHYGIAVTNKYSLFLDDDCDPYEILKSTEEATLKSKTDKSKKDAKNEAKAAKSAKNKGPVKKPVTPISDQPKGVDVNANKKEGEQKPRGRGKPTDGERTGSARPGGNREGFGNREFDRPPRRDRQMDRERGERGGERPPTEFRERGDRPESGRGRGRGDRGVGRGRGRGGRGGGFGNKREFERHSGSDKTGIKPVEKREGGGAHNWGTVKDDMEKEKASDTLNESANDETAEAPEGNENQNPNAEPTEEETPAEEEGPKEMTLDEWRAQQTQDRAKTTFNIRKPGEGVSGEQWKKTYVLKKKPEVKTESDEEESDEEEEEDPRHKKNLLNIEITFNDQPTRGRGGRRGRGGSERGGGRGRGGDRGGRGGGGERGDRGDRAPGERRGGFGGPRGGGGERGDRGGDRGGHRREAAPHIEDENDFPTLGAK